MLVGQVLAGKTKSNMFTPFERTIRCWVELEVDILGSLSTTMSVCTRIFNLSIRK